MADRVLPDAVKNEPAMALGGMARVRRFTVRPLVLYRASIICLCGIAFCLYLVQRGISYRELIIIFGALVLGVIIFTGERGIQLGFVLWVLTLALGYRTLPLTKDLQLHPAEILLWVLLGCICLHRQVRANHRLSLPIWMLLLLPFCVLAWWPLILGRGHWDEMLNEFRNFALLVPLMIVATVVLQDDRNWRRLVLAFIGASSWIAVLGIAEFWLPSVSHQFSSFMTATSAGLIEGFDRAAFSFWGGPMATFVCALALPFCILAVRWWPAAWQRVLIVATAAAQLVAIYIGGYRSIWFFILLEVVLACFLSLKRQRVSVAVTCLVLIIGGFTLVPQTGNQRALSGIAALRGHPTDSSARDRINRAQNAFDEMLAVPLGNGWTAAGWVHSDFIQVGANLGVAAGLIFLGGYLYTLGRLFRRVLSERAAGHADIEVSLFLSFISAGGILATQGVEVLPQLILPVWFVWVLVEVWLIRSTSSYKVGASANALEGERTMGSWYGAPLAGSPSVRP